MRYIDTSTLAIPANWVQLARNGNFNPLWSYLKGTLESLVGKKCWYNESINDGAINPVDHFRPKTAQVRVLTPKYADLDKIVWGQLSKRQELGYPFLELESSNYRYACGFANSAHQRESIGGITRGKWDFFPLKIKTRAASTIGTLSSESIALLDPCNIQDPKLLRFTAMGDIEPSERVMTGSWDYCRVKVSIEVYHLTYFVITGRRQETWILCENRIEILTKLYNKPQKTEEEQLAFNHIYGELIRSLLKKSEYSAVSIDCVYSFIKKKDPYYNWITTEIPSVLLEK